MPNGEGIGYSLGDGPKILAQNLSVPLGHRTSAKIPKEENSSAVISSHSWGIFFTILGTVLLDFDADACQSPARAYLLDVTVPGIVINLAKKKICFFQNQIKIKTIEKNCFLQRITLEV